ncbi:hypothetical protein SDC9_192139 [bioreactor metagenome]|uniref:Uncharacterized protein n=1 Tax=bioreactor metagenome TaxID=1076179 RepID=A0A645I8D8_9ZZZZ
MPAVPHEQMRKHAEIFKQIDALNAATGAGQHAVLLRKQDYRQVESLAEPRSDNADHARIPVRVREQQHVPFPPLLL